MGPATITEEHMSYIRADQILPNELLEIIQQYVDGKLLYIPCKEKQEWGSGTSAKKYFCDRNKRIYDAYLTGLSLIELSRSFCLSEKSIQRILRTQKTAAAQEEHF